MKNQEVMNWLKVPVKVIGTEDVLVLKNHGVICVSDNLKEAESTCSFC